ncbi:MAG TPA: hypothetical protein VLG46_14460, partial [Anaerolineae bacterium]|nr:hypothetical protein [Anaerolineae bacterium]
MLRLKCYNSDPIEAFAAIFAELGSPAIGLFTVRTDRFEPPAARVTKSRLRKIFALTLRANHNGIESQICCIIPNPGGLTGAIEGSKQCIVPGYIKSKLKDGDKIDARRLYS